MNEAILGGLLKAGTDPGDVVATVRRAERASELAERYHGITAIAGEEEPDNNRQAAKGSAVVILGVKPVGIADLAREISPALSPDTVVVSVAAGLFALWLGFGVGATCPGITVAMTTTGGLYGLVVLVGLLGGLRLRGWVEQRTARSPSTEPMLPAAQPVVSARRLSDVVPE